MDIFKCIDTTTTTTTTNNGRQSHFPTRGQSGSGERRDTCTPPSLPPSLPPSSLRLHWGTFYHEFWVSLDDFIDFKMGQKINGKSSLF
ncbi:hypothetical protein E2C01_077926 [Portunus trituberculatus]|uniref:Uncharacterized protein n=1 Tax=Portunus trituberculatus TaxID=210409 RepID=A0A5B7IH81_PORTR|nr:hypothetical protein [Portunus trituberculatus]